MVEAEVRPVALMKQGPPRDIADWWDHWFESPFRTMTRWIPDTVRVEDRDDQVIVRVEVPGIDPKDLDLTVHPHSLTVRGEWEKEMKSGRDDDEDGSREGRFVRTVSFPVEVQPDLVEARYHHGVLRITLPKKDPDLTGHKVRIRNDDEEGA